MPPQILEHRLANVRSRVRQVLMAYGVSRLVSIVVGSVLAACLGDWLIHFDDPILRLILAVSILGGAVWVARRSLVSPLKIRFSDVDLALRIENRYPGFHDSLASTVQFVGSGADPRLGSPALQRAVVERTIDRLDGLECADVVDTREVRRMGAIAAAVALIAVLLTGFSRAQALIALNRLFLPFSAPAWPRSTNLRILNADLAPIESDRQN